MAERTRGAGINPVALEVTGIDASGDVYRAVFAFAPRGRAFLDKSAEA